jgi:hypothetical protein
MWAKTKTVGVSPKTTAAAVAALVGPLVARLVGDLLGVEVESETVEGLILAGVAAVSAGLAAYKARPGVVIPDRAVENRFREVNRMEKGYGVVDAILVVFLVIVVLVVLSWLLWTVERLDAVDVAAYLMTTIGAVLFARWTYRAGLRR